MVTIYTQESCAPCLMVKKFLQMKNVEYEEVPREGNEETMLELGGKITTPLVKTDKGISYGFNPTALSELI